MAIVECPHDENAYEVICDWCGDSHSRRIGDHGGHPWVCMCPPCEEYRRRNEYRDEIWPRLFGLVNQIKVPAGFPEQLCRKCSVELTPWVSKFADLWALNKTINTLQRSIYERRKENR